MESAAELNLDTTKEHAAGEITGQRLRLTIVAPSIAATHLGLTLHVKQWNLELTYHWGCDGEDLVRFADSLERLHGTLEGEAIFWDLDQVVELTFKVADRARGRISVEGRIDQRLDRGIRNLIPLRGFELEQSYVHGIVRDIRRFISESGISILPPRKW
jgi:hypothetical protein